MGREGPLGTITAGQMAGACFESAGSRSTSDEAVALADYFVRSRSSKGLVYWAIEPLDDTGVLDVDGTVGDREGNGRAVSHGAPLHVISGTASRSGHQIPHLRLPPGVS